MSLPILPALGSHVYVLPVKDLFLRNMQKIVSVTNIQWGENTTEVRGAVVKKTLAFICCAVSNFLSPREKVWLVWRSTSLLRNCCHQKLQCRHKDCRKPLWLVVGPSLTTIGPCIRTHQISIANWATPRQQQQQDKFWEKKSSYVL